MDDLLAHAKYALLPFLGNSSCNSLASTCKQGNEAVKSIPHCTYLEGKSLCIQRARCQLRYKRNAFYACTRLAIDFLTVLMNGTIVIMDRQSQSLFSICPQSRKVNPLQGKEINRIQVPYNVWGLCSDKNTLTLAHAGLIRSFDLSGSEIIELGAVLLMDEDVDTGAHAWKLIQTPGGFECLLSNNLSLRMASNGEYSIRESRVKAFFENSRVRCECTESGISVQRPGNQYMITNEFVEPTQVLSECGLVIHVLDSLGIWSFYGRQKRMLFPCRGIKTMHLHRSSLFYVDANNDIYLLQ
jgi:hypothetical protein